MSLAPRRQTHRCAALSCLKGRGRRSDKGAGRRSGLGWSTPGSNRSERRGQRWVERDDQICACVRRDDGTALRQRFDRWRSLTGVATKAKPRRKYSHAQARNLMRRAIEEIIDPGPTSIDPLWEWFDSRSAYCGAELQRGERNAHADHAEPGGGNHIGNLILSCGTCNGDEKRDMPWSEFLRLKATDEETFLALERRILDWMAANPAPVRNHGPEVEELRQRCEDLVEEFRAACNALEDAVKRPGQPPGTGRRSTRAAQVWPDGSDEATVVAARRSLRSPSWVNLQKGVRSLLDLEHEPFGTDNVRNTSRSQVNRIARETGLSLLRLMDLFDHCAGSVSSPGT